MAATGRSNRKRRKLGRRRRATHHGACFESAWAHQVGAAHVAAYGQGLKPWAFGSGAFRKGQEGSVVLRTTEPS